MKLPKVLTLVAFFGSMWTLFNLSGCATARPAPVVQEPGVYNTYGWNGAEVWYTAGKEVGEAPGQDINGEVGHPLYVKGPSTVVVPSSESSTSSKRVVSGVLPPGMALDGVGAITGIPTERGHWIVTMETYDRLFRGKSYKSYQQQLRFHITGSGRVSN